MELSELAHAILEEGTDDWVSLGLIVHAVQTQALKSNERLSDARLLAEVLEVVRELLQPKLMRLGDIKERRFVEWPGGVKACLDRVEKEWLALGRPPSLGEVAWLESTERGLAQARKRDG